MLPQFFPVVPVRDTTICPLPTSVTTFIVKSFQNFLPSHIPIHHPSQGCSLAGTKKEITILYEVSQYLILELPEFLSSHFHRSLQRRQVSCDLLRPLTVIVCQHSFLRFWSNPRRADSDRIQSSINEIVDILLVLFVLVIGQPSRSPGESIRRSMLLSRHVPYIKVKKADPSKPSRDQSSREIISSTVQLRDQSISI